MEDKGSSGVLLEEFRLGRRLRIRWFGAGRRGRFVLWFFRVFVRSFFVFVLFFSVVKEIAFLLYRCGFRFLSGFECLVGFVLFWGRCGYGVGVFFRCFFFFRWVFYGSGFGSGVFVLGVWVFIDVIICGFCLLDCSFLVWFYFRNKFTIDNRFVEN